MNTTGFFPSSPLAWGRNREWPLRHILSHEVIIFTSAAVRLIMAIIPAYKEKKLELLSTLSLVSSWLMWRETFSGVHQKRKILVPPSLPQEQQGTKWGGAEEEGSSEEPFCWPGLNFVKFAQGTMKHLHLLYSSSVGTVLAEPLPNLLLHN